MAVRIRLARVGAKKKPFYRVVVTDSRSPRDGRFIEIVGRYDPRPHPSLVELELDRIKDWIAKGAAPSETVSKLIAIAEAPEAKAPETAKDKKPSRKAQGKAETAEETPEDAGTPEVIEMPQEAEDSEETPDEE